MTPPGKSAALRVSPRAESSDTGAAGFEAAVRNAAAARLRPRATTETRDKLLTFPGVEPARAPAASSDRSSDQTPDLSGELESALMSDLQSMVALFDEVARTPSDVEPSRASEPVAAEPAQAPEPDQEALDRLLASIRQSDRAPRRPLPAMPEPNLDDAAFARGSSDQGEPAIEAVVPVALAESLAARALPDEVPQPKRNPNSPRPSGRDDRLNAPLPRARKPVASPGAPPRIASKAEPVPALRLAIPGARRAYVKPVIAVSLLILLAAVGAGMTIRTLTARNDTAPTSTTVTTAEPAATAPVADVAAKPPAKIDDTPAAASVPSTPTTIAKTETQPMAATPAVESPARPAVDNSAQHAIPAEMTQPTVLQVTPAPAPTVPLQPAVTDSEAPAANVAATEPAPVAPTETAVAAPKPATTSGVTAGSLQPGPGRIASGVKLRTNPDNGAPVIGVLGQGTSVQIVSCKGWCEVVAGDKRGFVYQKFLTSAGG